MGGSKEILYGIIRWGEGEEGGKEREREGSVPLMYHVGDPEGPICPCREHS